MYWGRGIDGNDFSLKSSVRVHLIIIITTIIIFITVSIISTRSLKPRFSSVTNHHAFFSQISVLAQWLKNAKTLLQIEMQHMRVFAMKIKTDPTCAKRYRATAEMYPSAYARKKKLINITMENWRSPLFDIQPLCNNYNLPFLTT